MSNTSFDSYVEEMINDWTNWNICPIVDGQMLYLEDHATNTKYWGEAGSKFLTEHFESNINLRFHLLDKYTELDFIVLALQHHMMYEALRDYIVFLIDNKHPISSTLQWINRQILRGVDPFEGKRKGAAEKGRNAKFYWRDSLIAITVDVWKDRYPSMRIRVSPADKNDENFGIVTVIEKALAKSKPKFASPIKSDAIYNIYRKIHKEAAL